MWPARAFEKAVGRLRLIQQPVQHRRAQIWPKWQQNARGSNDIPQKKRSQSAVSTRHGNASKRPGTKAVGHLSHLNAVGAKDPVRDLGRI